MFLYQKKNKREGFAKALSCSDLVVKLVARDAVPATLVFRVRNFDLVVGALVTQAAELRVDVRVPLREVLVQVED